MSSGYVTGGMGPRGKCLGGTCLGGSFLSPHRTCTCAFSVCFFTDNHKIGIIGLHYKWTGKSSIMWLCSQIA